MTSVPPSPAYGPGKTSRSEVTTIGAELVVMRLIEPLGLGSVCGMPIAVSSFVLESFDEEPPFMEDPGVQYARIRIAKKFHGDIEAQSTVEMLSVRG